MKDPSVVIVGAGHAGVEAAAALRARGFGGAVTLVGEERALPYQRPPLSKRYLHDAAAHAALRDAGFYAAERIGLRTGVRVAAIDRRAQRVTLDDGERLAYDHLVLATGTRARRLDLPGAEADGVLTLRTLADADALRARLHAARSLVIVGAGFIGLELAAAARPLGVAVHVLESAPRALSRVASSAAAAHLVHVQAAEGARFTFGAFVAGIDAPNGRVAGVTLDDGRHLAADVVVVAAGAVPNVELAAAAGLAVDDGVVVDAGLATSDPAIFAIGDCARFPAGEGSMRLESVQNAADQARAMAARLTGDDAPYARVPWFWSDQGTQRLQIAGVARADDEAIVRGDPARGAFSVFRYRGGALVAVESINRPADHAMARRLLSGGRTPSPAQAADPGFDLAAFAAGRAA